MTKKVYLCAVQGFLPGYALQSTLYGPNTRLRNQESTNADLS